MKNGESFIDVLGENLKEFGLFALGITSFVIIFQTSIVLGGLLMFLLLFVTFIEIESRKKEKENFENTMEELRKIEEEFKNETRK